MAKQFGTVTIIAIALGTAYCMGILKGLKSNAVIVTNGAIR